MSQLIIADAAVLSFVILLGLPIAWFIVIISIIPIEILILGLFFNLQEKIQVSIPLLLLMTLAANTATSILGIPLAYYKFIERSYIVFLIVLIVCFAISFVIEGIIYISFFNDKYQISNLKIMTASFLSNLASYAILIAIGMGFIK